MKYVCDRSNPPGIHVHKLGKQLQCMCMYLVQNENGKKRNERSVIFSMILRTAAESKRPPTY